jgi:putative transposase
MGNGYRYKYEFELHVDYDTLDQLRGILEEVTERENVRCKFCQSHNVVKNGIRRGTQYWLCKDCGHGFVATDALPRGRYPVEVMARAVYDYYAGVSLNKLRWGIEQQTGTLPSDSSVYGWLKKLTEIGLKEAKKYHPEVGDKFVADETVVRLNGKKFWLINVIDSDTRFLLASNLSTNRSMRDIKATLEVAKEKAGKSPKVILTDGWRGYVDAIERVFGADTTHIISTPFERKELSTNVVERWNGTLKDRLKPMRGMDKSETTQLVLDGFVFYYNHFRPHESLGDRTPAEAAKIKFPYKNWLDVAKSLIPHEKRSLVVGIRESDGELITIRKPYRKMRKPKKRVRKAKFGITISGTKS